MPALIKTNERLAIAGKTGSGKTYLARYLTRRIKRLVVCDSKGTLQDWNLYDYDERAARRSLEKGEPARIRVLAPITDDPGAYWDDIFQWAFEIGDLTIYIDEAYAITPPGKRAPTYLNACFTRGREFGIGVWTSTQRPTWIPLFMLSESDHFFMFRLTLADDRRRMAEFMTDEVLQPIPAADRHGFFYMPATEDQPVYYSQLETSALRAERGRSAHA